MLKVKTLNDSLLFDNKEELVTYFGEGIQREGQKYFDDNNYYIEIEGERITNVENWEYWKDNFNETLHGLLEELKDLIGTEFTLLDMDNTVKEIIDAVGEHKNSIFDGETEKFIEKGEYAYSVWANEEEREVRDVCIYFEVLDKYEDNLETTVKVVDIELV